MTKVYVWLPDGGGGSGRKVGRKATGKMGRKIGGWSLEDPEGDPGPDRVQGIDVGHAAIHVGGECYLSLYPAKILTPSEYLAWVDGVYKADLVEDSIHMGRKRDFECSFTELDEGEMLAFARKFKADCRYHLKERNCATGVGETLLAGFRGRNRGKSWGDVARMMFRGSTWGAVATTAFAGVVAWTPELVKDFAETLAEALSS